MTAPPDDDAISAGPWPVAVFAHNEQATIEACLDSLTAAADGQPLEIFVLANGCTDHTESIVADRARANANIHLISIAKADKANAWNTYIHDHAPASPVHFFIDGDVRACPEALALLEATLDAYPLLNAVGAMPTTGRRRVGWRRKMESIGMLAGNLYALAGHFVERIQHHQVRIPVEYIGEDFLVSRLAVTNLLEEESEVIETSRIAFSRLAGFEFRSLSWTRFDDWRVYWKRKRRYGLRALQNSLLYERLDERGRAGVPRDVDQLYSEAEKLPPLCWRGHNTFFDLLARRHVRRRAAWLRRQET